MSKTAKENDHEFLNVPDGFIKMDWYLTFTPKQIVVWEQDILRMLVRDYYIFYAKVDKFNTGEFIELHFFCRPKDQSGIIYRLGILHQAMFGSESADKISNANHRVPDNFPGCIHIECRQVSKGNLDDVPTYKCSACDQELIEHIPGKHMCANHNCIEFTKEQRTN